MICRLSGVAIGYGTTPVLTGVDLDVGTGESIALVGPSGSGKSSLLLAIAGLLKPTAGLIEVCGVTVSRADREVVAAMRRRHLGIVFQFGELIPELSLVENVALPLRLAGTGRRSANAEATGLLASLGVANDVARRRPEEVSGGQAQRAAVARAVVHRPSLVLADEPTGALAQADAGTVFDLLMAVTRDRGAALVLATHDPGLAASVDRIEAVQDSTLVAT